MEYECQVKLDVNGKSITDFKTFTDDEEEIHKRVKLMIKIGFMAVTPSYGMKVDYVVPLTAPEIDWKTVKNGRVTVEYDSGRRVTYTGVYLLKVGEKKTDGENETVRTVELGASGKVEE